MSKKCDVLIADDDRVVNYVIQEWVLDAGYSSYMAENAYQALGTLRSKSDIGVLVTDIRMPVMDGNELIREALKIRPDLGVIIMTGYADQIETPENCPVLHKPFQPSELMDALARVCERQNPN